MMCFPRMAPALSALCLLLTALILSVPVGFADSVDVDVRAETRRISKDFAAAKSAEQRMAVVESIPKVADKRLAKAIIQSLEETLDVQANVQKRLDQKRAALRPLLGRKLMDKEWAERDALEIDIEKVGRELMAENRVALALVDRLAGLESDEVATFLADWGLRNRSWRIRAEVLEVLGDMGGADARDSIVIATEDKDPRVRQVAVEQAAALAGNEVVTYLVRRLEDEELQVQAAAIESLLKRQAQDAVGPLILAMEKSGRIRDDCARALEVLTGQSFGDNVRAWRDWWVENHLEELRVVDHRDRRKERRGVSYHNIRVNSEAIVFVVDISDSMREPAASVELTEAGIAERDDVKRSKFDVMIKELIGSIGSLPESASFNVIVYNHDVVRWKDDMQTATKKSKNEALEFLLGIEPNGGTNIFDALELAFESAGFGTTDRYYEPLVDTIYFLSDGAPSAGRLTEPAEILAEIDRLNRFRKITIYSIGMGRLHDKLFMESLARAHRGEYVCRY